MLPSYYEFINSVKILSGKLAVENIPYELNRLGAERPMILTDKALLKVGLVEYVLGALENSDIIVGAVYSDIPPDSSVQVVNDIVQVYAEHKCDSLIAVGGGSVIDSAKGASILITEGSNDLMQFMGLEILKTSRRQPFIVVPTTAGTGSEVTTVAVIADKARNVKMEFIAGQLLPDVAVLDPRMTISLPAKLTASTGMDCLAHAIEAYSCLQKNPLSDAFACSAITLWRENLLLAVKEGKNIDARLAMSNASLMAGVAFSNSMVGIVHAIGHACGGVCHVPHGDAMAILLPACMEYNLDKVEPLYAELLLPLAGSEVYAATPKESRARKSIQVVREMMDQLNKLCGLPTRLRDAGVSKDDFAIIAASAINDGAAIVNPKEFEISDVIHILENAF